MATITEAKKQRGSNLVNIKRTLAPRVREAKFSLFLFRKSVLAIIGLSLILFVVIIALAAPFITTPNTPDSNIVPRDFASPKPPGATTTINENPYSYPFGAGRNGEDIYYGVVWGARTSIYSAVMVVGISLVIGVCLGAVAGYYGGAVDEVLMRITDIFLSVPALILAMAVVAAMQTNSLDTVLFALIIVWWPSYARIMRGQVLSIKESTYVEAARAVGAKRNRILFKHIVPNSLSPLLVSATMDMGAVVLVAAGLSFIGFTQPGVAEWGRMVSDGAQLMLSQYPYPYPAGPMFNPWWAWVLPGTFIFIFVMGFNLLGDGLRDLMDPRLRR